MLKFLKNDLWKFCFIHFFVWTIVPCFRKSIPLDSVEAVTWGRYCDWGTNKHPPLSGFFADWFFTLFGDSAVGLYVLSQICVFVGFIYIFKLARCFLDDKKSLLSVMLLEGVIYYGFSAQEYNVNVLSLALWPLTAYYFYKALRDDKISAWILTGVFAGLNVFNKYVGGVLLIGMAAYLLLTKDGRRQFAKVGPYVTFAVFLLVIAPHLWWLYQYDFYPFEYLLGRVSEQEGALWQKIAEHFYFPLKFLAAQFAFGAMAVLIYFLVRRRGEKMQSPVLGKDRAFLFYLGVFPVLFFAGISFVLGMRLKSMWGFPTLYLLGVILFAICPFKLTDALYAKMKKYVYIAMFLFASAALAVIFLNKGEKFNFDGKGFAAEMSEIWQKHTGAPLEYVGGEIWYVANVSVYGERNPKPIAMMKPKYNPWFDEQDILRKGALVIFPDKRSHESVRKEFSGMSAPEEYKLEFRNRLGKIKQKTIYLGFLEPSAGEKHE